GLWLLARASTYHLLKVFTELSDHAGLEPGSILSNTRNSPANWLSALLHPHADNYHLAHHLAPRVPTWRLPALHALLLGVEAYRAGHHCDGYFLGRSSVVRGWRRAGGADATAGPVPPPTASAPHAPKGGGA
ncbi:MAG TPA: fatty acid desaturase, partial [Polyangiaceae bacterium]|nr:fatty acid desaturase [Polyangiaceae bacterium]